MAAISDFQDGRHVKTFYPSLWITILCLKIHFHISQICIDSIDVMICEILHCTKGNPDIHVLTEGDQEMELVDENHHGICVHSAYQTVGTVILKGIL